MGCTSSKLDDLPAVALCRERCAFLDEAIHQRYALAESHIAYIRSLQSVGLSLHHFFHLDLDQDHDHSAGPPSHRKAGPQPSDKPPAAHHHHSSSGSGSHLHFHSDSEDEDSPSASLHHLSDSPTPLHPYADPNSIALGPTYPLPASGRFMHVNFMRNQSTPSVTYQQRPMSPDTVRMGDSSSSYYPYPYPKPPNPCSFYNYPSFAGGFFGSSPPGHYSYSSPPTVVAGPSSEPSASEKPPPPPPPPTTSAWDFLNPFESFENFYRPYSPSRDSREVREEEGIPDLEEEDFEHEVVKEVHGDQKFVDSAGGGSYPKAPAKDEDDKPNDSESLYQTRPGVSVENDPVEYEVHVVDKKVVDDSGTPGDRTNARGFKARGGFKGTLMSWGRFRCNLNEHQNLAANWLRC